jgi:hypothetical protein
MFRSKEQQAAQSKSSKFKQSLSADWSQYVGWALASIEFVYDLPNSCICIIFDNGMNKTMDQDTNSVKLHPQLSHNQATGAGSNVDQP